MNWDATRAIGEIFGALAVVVWVAYLAVYIRQNTKSMKAGAERELSVAASANLNLAITQACSARKISQLA